MGLSKAGGAGGDVAMAMAASLPRGGEAPFSPPAPSWLDGFTTSDLISLVLRILCRVFSSMNLTHLLGGGGAPLEEEGL